MQRFPPLPSRINTGPVKFGDDWPGYFYRGDEVMQLIQLLEYIAREENCDEALTNRLMREANRLRECRVESHPN